MLEDGHVNGYVFGMACYSVAETKNQLTRLLDRMLAGEEVTITRRGKEIAQLAPKRPAEPGFVIDPEWVDRNQVQLEEPLDAVTALIKMRREYRY